MMRALSNFTLHMRVLLGRINNGKKVYQTEVDEVLLELEKCQ